MAEENEKVQAQPDEPTPKASSAETATEPPAAEQAKAETSFPKQESLTAPPLPEGTHYIWGTGRRKKSVARVRIRPGTGQILINKRQVDDYFHHEKDRQVILAPLSAAGAVRSWDVWANVGGGGSTGQAGAVALGMARAIIKALPELEAALRDKGLLTRDARMSERKKYGQKGARKRFQFSKR